MKIKLLNYFLLILVNLIVYSRSLFNDFCYDENIVILKNENVQKDGQILNIFKSSYWGSSEQGAAAKSYGYRPLTILSFYLNRKISGSEPFGYHLTNVVLHTAVSLLFYAFLLSLRFSTVMAMGGGILFSVHAIHTEAVSQIAGRAELLSSLFVLLCLFCHIYITRKETNWGLNFWTFCWVAAPLCFFAGMLAKENAGSLLIFTICTDFLILRNRRHKEDAFFKCKWHVYVMYLIVIVFFLLIRWLLFGRPFPLFNVHFVDNPIVSMPSYLRPFGALLVFGKVVLLLLFPLHLSADYGFNQLPVNEFYKSGLFYFGAITVISVTCMLLVLRKRLRLALYGWILFVLTYLPVMNVLFPVHTILGERILYIPSIGFCIFIIGLAQIAISSKQRILKWGVITIFTGGIIFNFIRTIVRNGDWKNDITLFESAAKVSTNSVRVLNNYGNVLFMRGEFEKAEEYYRKALQIFPEYDDAAINLASVLIRKGEVGEAVSILINVLRRKPDNMMAKKNFEIAIKLKQNGMRY